MGEYRAVVEWSRDGARFTDNRYSRAHRWSFDGGIEVAASASPSVVPAPHSVAAAVDPEEAFVAALASCHMLWFLSFAAKAGFVVESYRDEARAALVRDQDGGQSIHEVVLSPAVRFHAAKRPSSDQHRALHEQAHAACFLARSVRCDVRCEPRDATA